MWSITYLPRDAALNILLSYSLFPTRTRSLYSHQPSNCAFNVGSCAGISLCCAYEIEANGLCLRLCQLAPPASGPSSNATRMRMPIPSSIDCATVLPCVGHHFNVTFALSHSIICPTRSHVPSRTYCRLRRPLGRLSCRSRTVSARSLVCCKGSDRDEPVTEIVQDLTIACVAAASVGVRVHFGWVEFRSLPGNPGKMGWLRVP